MTQSYGHFHIVFLIAFPHCKINLGLQVLQKRSDGFHDIQTIFYPVPLKDALEIITAQHLDSASLQLYGLPIGGEAADNLCTRAWQLLKNEFPALPSVDIHLLKNIPMGAGLGGGSADGAFMLRLLSDKFRLGLSAKQLVDYAAQLGSDCPFFIMDQPCFATGRGELLKPIKLDLSGYQLVLVNPRIHINTGWAFSQFDLHQRSTANAGLETIISQPVETWPEQLINDFETPVFREYPEIQSIKAKLYESGALYAAMSGSGSTVFGIFDKNIGSFTSFPTRSRLIRL